MLNIIYPLGHSNVSNYIINMLKNDMLHRSLIFSGQKGIGKASYAVALAKFLLSHDLSYYSQINNVEDLSIGQENIITLINAQTHPDYLYIRPSEKLLTKIINVEQIRNITNSLVLTSDNNKYKVIIIDAIDDMNINACNALLKILEEPPQNVIFLLITHNYSNVLPTIKSRCLNIPFNKLDTPTLQTLLERNGIFNDNLEEVLHYADGSYTNLVEIINNREFYNLLKELIFSTEADYNISIFINKYAKEIKEANWQVLVAYIRTLLIKHTAYDINKKQEILIKIKEYTDNTKLLNLDKNHILYMLILLINKS